MDSDINWLSEVVKDGSWLYRKILSSQLIFQLRYVENRVYSRFWWELEFLGQSSDLPHYRVRPKEFGGQFQVYPYSYWGLTIRLQFDKNQVVNFKGSLTPLMFVYYFMRFWALIKFSFICLLISHLSFIIWSTDSNLDSTINIKVRLRWVIVIKSLDSVIPMADWKLELYQNSASCNHLHHSLDLSPIMYHFYTSKRWLSLYVSSGDVMPNLY